MKKASFSEALQGLLSRDPRYPEGAYFFVREGLDHTIKQLDKPTDGPGRHVSGSELCQGLRELALKEYGPMAKTLLSRWGISETADFGHIVFNLVSEGILGKTEEDRLDDFTGVYDFDDAFSTPFHPSPPRQRPPRPADPE